LDWCKKQIAHIRIDTHHDNVVMQHVVQKAGFQRCGIIYIADGTPRIAYELL
jgi:RimJ/RimL family protein N-acetyltransferase